MSRAQKMFALLSAEPRPDQMVAVLDRYRELMAAGDLDAIANLFVQDAHWEEPVGTPVVKGRDAIRACYAEALASQGGAIRMEADGETRVAGNAAIACSKAHVNVAGTPVVLLTANAIVCNDAGEITEMRIYVGPSNVRL